MMEKRHSYFKSNLKVRAEGQEDKYIEGYFIVFNQKTELWPHVFEKIAPNAIDNSLLNNDIRCLFNHNSDFVLGRKSAKTLELKVDNVGLYGKVKINQNDQAAMDVYARVERGDITGCSFGFYPISESYDEEGEDITWTVKEADTHEISVCTFPAYPQTEIEARERDYKGQSKKRLEQRKADIRKRLEGIQC
ncbi:MAG: HK97 family phage prohead protease [Acetivibrio ethanolgignens]